MMAQLQKRALLLFFFVVTGSPVVAQSNPQKLAECHARIKELDGLEEKLANTSPSELGRWRGMLDGCLRSNYTALTKKELSAAGIELEWIQYSIDLAKANDTEASSSGSLKTGSVRVSALELGEIINFTFSGSIRHCHVVSTDGLSCPADSWNAQGMYFTAAVISQGAHQFLIGCIPSDDTCVRPEYGTQTVQVENTTVRFTSYSVITTDPTTGRSLDSRPAFFTLLKDL